MIKGDKIRAMNNDELAIFLTIFLEKRHDAFSNNFNCNKCENTHCTECIKKWLTRESD